MSYQVPLGYVPISSSALWPLGLSKVEQVQRPSRNEDREAIEVGAGLCDGEGEHMPHIMIFPGVDIFIPRVGMELA